VAGAESALKEAGTESVSSWSASRAKGSVKAGEPLPELVPSLPGAFRATLSFGAAYDTNVLLSPDGSIVNLKASDVASPKLAVAAQGGYAKNGFHGGDLETSAGVAADYHTNANARAYDNLGLSAGADYGRGGPRLGDRFNLNLLDGNFFSWDNVLALHGTLANGFGGETDLELPLRYQKFAVHSGDDPAYDRTGPAVGARVTRRQRWGAHLLSGGLAFDRLFARGDNYKSYLFSVPLTWQWREFPIWNISSLASFTPSLVRYPDSAQGRDDTNVLFSFGLSRPFLDRLQGVLEYGLLRNISNVPGAQYTNQTVSLRVIYAML
jgi:hypothetical protein